MDPLLAPAQPQSDAPAAPADTSFPPVEPNDTTESPQPPSPTNATNAPDVQTAGGDDQQDLAEDVAEQPEAAVTPAPQSPTDAPKSASAGVVAKRLSRSGRQVILDASSRVDPLSNRSAAAMGTHNGMVAAVSLNAQYKTIPEEHAEFRAKNRIRSSYRGPVYTVEDVCVLCHACGGPVDPVRRVPVGSLFFHENCLQCYLCGRRQGTAGLYMQVDRQAVCCTCAARGYERWVPRQEAQSRGMIFGAIQGDVYEAMDAHDRGERGLPRLPASPPPAHGLAAVPRTSVATGPVVAGSTLNRPTVPGALPPSLTIRPVHTARNTGRRSFALMERQQYYTQSDNNLLLRASEASVKTSSGTRRASKLVKGKRAEGSPEKQRITASDDSL
ncbi:hypothetical protein ABB37_02342 [Leptomonas pyrrhocoris]|uniref:LIM zinc-binding domain-containing protein n=1 Tax=Leptomonas pyrrhocoris TaxID=157538 RepID=A0A0N0VH54_LEPPY|nr:hypothetical protein ABB37_02342 [Leptomonas pyrrhocoris]KPA84338.1 hypothetical protein ABB37_02342 [Leptomonas pyrrhocoris]|eukprot:XP_015662777.1 hypothetical protein ABB37_02342 [Leptomonas pyrrhocoris]